MQYDYEKKHHFSGASSKPGMAMIKYYVPGQQYRKWPKFFPLSNLKILKYPQPVQSRGIS